MERRSEPTRRTHNVIPAQAEIQGRFRWPVCLALDPRLRGDDDED